MAIFHSLGRQLPGLSQTTLERGRNDLAWIRRCPWRQAIDREKRYSQVISRRCDKKSANLAAQAQEASRYWSRGMSNHYL